MVSRVALLVWLSLSGSPPRLLLAHRVPAIRGLVKACNVVVDINNSGQSSQMVDQNRGVVLPVRIITIMCWVCDVVGYCVLVEGSGYTNQSKIRFRFLVVVKTTVESKKAESDWKIVCDIRSSSCITEFAEKMDRSFGFCDTDGGVFAIEVSCS
jgi:hypothetical protein